MDPLNTPKGAKNQESENTAKIFSAKSVKQSRAKAAKSIRRASKISLLQAMQSAGQHALVALRGDKMVGFACFHDVGFRSYLSEMVVAESEQGHVKSFCL
ncbi:MAG TPA: hypothetical protein DCZ95_11095 [Verrucomicrobia bacterium]|nr:MAG: hypothetical protein A2X46_07890 [Lentisphaerae bacterium GWF2_57_35]HBA84630.1 hypothetical protein [Verrucomicrobiota bacterium]